MKPPLDPDDSKTSTHSYALRFLNRQPVWPKWIVAASVLLALTGGLAFVLLRASVHASAPGLTITLSTNSTVLLTVTNGATNVFYEIYSTNTVSSNLYWSLSMTGALGVTNFSVPMGALMLNFFKARAGNDWDGDGILNFQDANPNNSNAGVLSVTIDSPTNGSTIQ